MRLLLRIQATYYTLCILPEEYKTTLFTNPSESVLIFELKLAVS